MHTAQQFFESRTSEIIVGIVAGVVGSVAYGVLVWCWRRWVRVWEKRAERKKLIEAFSWDAWNFVENMPRWLDGDPANCFVLFPQGPKGVSKTIGPQVMEFVGKLQEHTVMRLGGFTGLFGFSKRQYDRMTELYDRLAALGAGVRNFGQPIRWDQKTAERNFDIEFVRAAWLDVLPLLRHEKKCLDIAFVRAMGLRYRFFGALCPKFSPASLPVRTDAKGIKVGAYFGPLPPRGKSAA